MASKRPREEDGTLAPDSKKVKKGFKPINLPDGPWRRKVAKTKKELIEKSKVKKAYAKIKASEEKSAPKETAEEAGTEEAKQQIHPERQAMLDEDPSASAPEQKERADSGMVPRRPRQPRQKRKPGYFDKALEEAERKKAEAEAREKEIQRRAAERNRRTAERERYQRELKKARKPGQDGQRRLGRESGLLLHKIQRITSEKK